jgi:hypothetical protein
MVKNKTGAIVVFFIALFIAYILINHLVSVRSFAQIGASSIMGIEKSGKEQLGGSQEVIIEKPKKEYGADDSRDPFRGYEEKQEQPPEPQTPLTTMIEEPLPNLEVQGIIWGGSIKQAIINNKIVKPGDMIDNIKILDINKDGITVLFSNRERNLSSPAAVNLKEIKGGKDEK